MPLTDRAPLDWLPIYESVRADLLSDLPGATPPPRHALDESPDDTEDTEQHVAAALSEHDSTSDRPTQNPGTSG